MVARGVPRQFGCQWGDEDYSRSRSKQSMMTIVSRTLVIITRMMVPHGQERGTPTEVRQPRDGIWPRSEEYSEEPILVAG